MSSIRFSAAVVLLAIGPLARPCTGQAGLPWRPVPAPALQDLAFDPDVLLWADDHRLVLTDGGEHQLVVVDVTNGTTARIGRQGGGPGEFGSSMLPVRAFGGLGAWDIAGRRYTEFDHDLKFLRVSPPVTAALLNFAAVEDSVLLGVTGFMGPPAVLRIDPVTGRVDSLFQVGALDTALLAKPDLGVANAPVMVGALGSGGHLVLYSSWSYAIVGVDRSGRVLFRGGRRGMPVIPATPARIAERRERMMRAMGQIDTAALRRMGPVIERALNAPDAFIRTGGLGDDASGCLYAVTFRKHADSTEVDVFTRDARFVRTLAVPGTVKAVSRGGPLVAFISERASGESEGTSDVLLYRPNGAGAACR